MKITEKATEELKRMLIESKTNASGIRIFEVQTCCSSSILFRPAEKAEHCDINIYLNDINLFIEPELNEKIRTANIDFSNGQFNFDGSSKSGGCC